MARNRNGLSGHKGEHELQAVLLSADGVSDDTAGIQIGAERISDPPRSSAIIQPILPVGAGKSPGAVHWPQRSPPMFRFTIRDLLWLTVVVALGGAWSVDRLQQSGRADKLSDYVELLEAECARLRPPPSLEPHFEPGQFDSTYPATRKSQAPAQSPPSK
jgi:hypothetical protein